MRIGLSAVSVAVGMTAFACNAIADDRSQDPRQIATEIRVLTVPAGFGERAGIKLEAGRGLTKRELRRLTEAVQGLRDANVLHFPRVTSDNGVNATIRVGEEKSFVTGFEAKAENGRLELVPTKRAIELGDSLSLCGWSSANAKTIHLRVKMTRVTEAMTDGYPLFATGTLTPEGGGGQVFAQMLHLPALKTEEVQKRVTVPDGGTVVIGGWSKSECAPPPTMITKIPYAEKLFKSGSREKTFEVIVLATARVLFFGAEEAGKPGDVKEAKKDK